jgi:hypothetical protein
MVFKAISLVVMAISYKIRPVFGKRDVAADVIGLLHSSASIGVNLRMKTYSPLAQSQIPNRKHVIPAKAGIVDLRASAPAPTPTRNRPSPELRDRI